MGRNLSCATSGKVGPGVPQNICFRFANSSGINSQDEQEIVVAWRRYGNISSKYFSRVLNGLFHIKF